MVGRLRKIVGRVYVASVSIGGDDDSGGTAAMDGDGHNMWQNWDYSSSLNVQ